MSDPIVVFVGERNPYGADPRTALLDDPAGSAGDRLRRVVLGLPRRVYLDWDVVGRVNLCRGSWGLLQARDEAGRVATRWPDAVLVLLGRRVASAFRFRDLAAFQRVPAHHLPGRDGGGLYARPRAGAILLPHPSGLCREWNRAGAVERARDLLRAAVPLVPWGSLLDEKTTGGD